MKTIYKYRLPNTPGIHWIEMPIHARPLTAQMQDGALFVWAEVDTENRQIPYEFSVQGTGMPMLMSPILRRYLSTVQDGPYVWQVYTRDTE